MKAKMITNTKSLIVGRMTEHTSAAFFLSPVPDKAAVTAAPVLSQDVLGGGVFYCCSSCQSKIYESEPRIVYKKIIVCSRCMANLIQEIYAMAGYGDGGLINLLFKDCLTRPFNRKRRRSMAGYKKILANLLHKYNFSCVLCGRNDNLTIDHILPVALGGGDEYSNLQILCRSCNSKKGKKHPDVRIY